MGEDEVLENVYVGLIHLIMGRNEKIGYYFLFCNN